MRTGAVYFSGYGNQNPVPYFLEACFLCRKSLGNDTDIFMYRGNTPFCSKECRQELIEMEEAKEKNWRASAAAAAASGRASSRKSETDKKAVRTGTVAAVA